MDQIPLALSLIGLLIIVIGVFSNLVKRTVFAEPLVAMAFGVLVGPAVLGLLDPPSWGPQDRILEETARLTLGIGLMGVALRLTREDVRGLWRPVSLLIVVGMIGMWLIASLLFALLLGLPLWLAFLIGAAITPTDPVLASAIVTGPLASKCLPEKLRATLSFESGANDGLAYLFVFLPILLVHHEAGAALGKWVLEILLLGVVLGVAVGAAIGYAAAKVLNWARSRGYMESYSYLTFTVTVSVLTLGAVRLAGSDDVLSVFVAGLLFDFGVNNRDKHEEENIQEAIGKLFTLPVFVLLGALLPWGDWLELGPAALLAVLACLVFRRLPILLMLGGRLRSAYGFSRRDVLFLGWFGPVGVAAVFYGLSAERHAGAPEVWPLVSLVVAVSVVLHGVTAAPFTYRYAKSRL